MLAAIEPMPQSIAQTIIQYQELDEDLGIAIERNDAITIEQLDRKMSFLFTSLLTASPATVKDTLTLIEFLLEHLVQSETGAKLSKEISSRILELVAAVTQLNVTLR